ncbi:hypothetical protein ACLMJK_004927 [Lecanora helva]
MNFLYILLVTTVTAVLAFRLPPQPSISQTPYKNTTTYRPPGFVYHSWPNVPFEVLVIDSIAMRFITVSPINVHDDETYNNEVRISINELAQWYSRVVPGKSLWQEHKENGPVVFEMRTLGSRTLTGRQIGLFLEHVVKLFSFYGPASVTVQLLYQETTRVGTFRIFVPLRPVAGS